MSDAANARKSATPWRGRSISGVRQTFGDNAKANRAALARMTVLEKDCGLTHAEFEALHAAQRERVRARYGLTQSIREGQS